ncbi:hypothetical protein DdX_14068 [Ditylenchus destructor]|uniref:Uncharacterized protein n=1 Tax=Ditylenchus destructor TaxID=166010 RepID=A0AAD4QVY5_9BILA|nr:hypothetical protein DdX_14068 [Ditylenchus destructor]
MEQKFAAFNPSPLGGQEPTQTTASLITPAVAKSIVTASSAICNDYSAIMPTSSTAIFPGIDCQGQLYQQPQLPYYAAGSDTDTTGSLPDAASGGYRYQPDSGRQKTVPGSSGSSGMQRMVGGILVINPN